MRTKISCTFSTKPLSRFEAGVFDVRDLFVFFQEDVSFIWDDRRGSLIKIQKEKCSDFCILLQRRVFGLVKVYLY